MTLAHAQRLKFLVRVIRKEKQHLLMTDRCLFALPLPVDLAESLENDQNFAERIDAFVSRFGRLQDTVADKLLPALLAALGEKTSSMLDNLDRVERLGLLKSADEWMTMRNLRNQMVHEYMEDTLILAKALQTSHEFVPALVASAEAMIAEIERRNWI
jgi:uncharacterized protein with HEPN domain